jgi:PE-PPE domain
MNKAVPGTVFTVSLLITGSLYPIRGSLYSTSTNKISRSAYALTSSDALVLIPNAGAANQEYAEAADNLYLEPNGFHGTATIFVLPEPSNLAASVAPGVQDLVQAVESQYSAGDFSASDPLYIFGYSQGAVVASLAEQQLANFGIPEQALHFVMVGDSASPEDGFMNAFVDSLPVSWQQPATELLTLLEITPPALGATTPDNLYPTDVYTLSGDGWVNWDNGANLLGMFTDHLAYLGLTPAEIASGTLSTDGLTDYFTINSAGVDIISAMWESLLVSLNIS